MITVDIKLLWSSQLSAPMATKFRLSWRSGPNQASFVSRGSISSEDGTFTGRGFDNKLVTVPPVGNWGCPTYELLEPRMKKKAKRSLYEEMTADENVLQVFYLFHGASEDYAENERRYKEFTHKFESLQAQTLNFKPYAEDSVEPPLKRPRPSYKGMFDDADEDEDPRDVAAKALLAFSSA